MPLNPTIRDFERDLRKQVLAEWPHQPQVRAELEAMDTHRLLVVYFNWFERLVPARPRRVHLSPELTEADHLRGPRGGGIRSALNEIERGDNLLPRLSKDVRHGYVGRPQQRKIRGRRDLDLLLNDWGVHHLHLGRAAPKGQFGERTADLLFVSFTDTDAYVIDVMPHQAWGRRHVLGVLARNWPDHGVIHPVRGTIGLSQHFSEAQGLRLRHAAVNQFVELPEGVFLPRGGMNLTGTSMTASIKANRVVHVLTWLGDQLAANPAYLTDALRTVVAVPDPPLWRMELAENGPQAVEEQTGGTVTLVE
jgi:hypothetical protein